MNLLIIDPDVEIHEYYRNLFHSIFTGINIICELDGDSAITRLGTDEIDLVITETLLPDYDIFTILYEVTSKNLPVVVISSEKSERLIVETLRAGALDFLTKKNLKLGLLEHIIKRAFLEGDRWMEILKFANTIRHRSEFDRENELLKAYLIRERYEKRNLNVPMGYLGDGTIALKEGETYNIIYLYIQLHFPEQLMSSYDQGTIQRMMREILSMCISISEHYGGRNWTKKYDGAFFAFLNESYQQAVIAALEIYANVKLYSAKIENLSEEIFVTMGIAVGQTVYHEDKSNIYCEALNLSAHLAINKDSRGSALWITSDIADSVSDGCRRYFQKGNDYEGSKVYKFEMDNMLKAD